MIKFTMGSSGNQKTHRRKPKRSAKSYVGHQNTAGGGTLCMPAVDLKSTVLHSSSLPATSTASSDLCNNSVDSSKSEFSPLMNVRFITSLLCVSRMYSCRGHSFSEFPPGNSNRGSDTEHF